ncbi:MAG TPA: anthranilate phosphoribosyltransferase [Bacteroidota bacterium]|nr:anthranilate phosphoribosyltransferase [Bacteroidota bacterium]
MIQKTIHKLVERNDLTTTEAYEAMLSIMSGSETDLMIAAFLTALRMKGETVAEISGCAMAMREKAVRIETVHRTVIDTCGTGGDGVGTFNISTAAAIIAASAGAVVAKHGNRAISSRAGSADVLVALGVNIEVMKEKVEACLNEVGIAFLFAPMMHGAMRFAAPVRRELGMRTVFNVLGPLTNPAGAKRQLLGVFSPQLTETMARVLAELGSERALVVHGSGGLDEISTLGETKVSELKNGKVTTYQFHHDSVRIPQAHIEALLGGDAAINAGIITHIMKGEKNACRDIAVLNAGAAIYVAGLCDTILDGVRLAQDCIDTGKAKRKLEQLSEFTR